MIQKTYAVAGDRAQLVRVDTGEVIRDLTVLRVSKSDVWLSNGDRCTHRGWIRANGWGGGTPTYKVVFP